MLFYWSGKMMELIGNRNITLKTHHNHPTNTSSLETIAIKNTPRDIHDQFLVTPIDKTNGYVVVKNLK